MEVCIRRREFVKFIALVKLAARIGKKAWRERFLNMREVEVPVQEQHMVEDR